MSEKIKILIVDDQKLIREGLKVLLELEKDFLIVGEASNGLEAYEAYIKLKPDVVLMDIQMPVMNGVEAIKKIKEFDENSKIIILTTFDDDQYVYDGLKSGALGYILKDTSIEKLSETIKIVYSGGALIEPFITKKILSELSKFEKTKKSKDELIEELNLRELEILRLISKGYTNQEIANKLNLSVGTVKNYVTTILQKIGAKDRTEAAILAKEIGII
ncbi:MAG: response regulator transcription factor [Caldisericia bacterium]|nr:response regulator transcription factor [Caldisericia bacterium]